MIRPLIEFALRFPWVIVGCAIAIFVGGAVRLQTANWDVFPEFAPPQITVQTEAPGLTTEEVERLIAMPVESALGGVSHIKTLRSSSVLGLCVVTAVFEEGTDLLTARQLVSERLTEVRTQLPDAAGQPRLMPLTSSTSRLVMLGLTADGGTSPQSLRTLADWTLRRRLQSVPGVAHVEVFGGEVKQFQVQVTPERLQQHALTLDEVVIAARSATGFGGAGFIETANQRFPVRQRTRIERPEDLAAVPVACRDGISLSLGDVADIRVAAADSYGGATINGQPSVMLIVHKQPDFNTLQVTDSVQTALDELTGTLPDDVTLHPLLFRQAAFIERAIGNLSHSLLLGCGLVTVVLILFLMNARVLLISLTAIPLSLMGAILVLLGCGASLNAMTLGGLAIALGELVDDAIVDVENVLRRLQENQQLAKPRPTMEVIRDASLEVRSAIVYASFIVMLVFLPVFFLDGLAGKLFGPLGVAYIAAIAVSLLIALTVTPAMCMLMLGRTTKNATADSWLVRACNAIYRGLLPPFVRHPWLVIAGALVMLASAASAIPFLGGEFLPDFRESHFVVFMVGKSDSSLRESERSGELLAKELLQITGVKSVAQQIGRADLSEDTWGTNISEVWIRLSDDADYDLVLGEIRERLNRTPGYAFQAKQFLRERIDEVLTGSTADLLVRVVGPDLGVLRQQADRVAAAIRDVEGLKDLRVEQLVEIPQLDILLNPQATAEFGMSVGATNQAIQTLLRGTKVGQVFESDSVCDVMVRASPSLRDDPRTIGGILIDGPLGHPLPLDAIADIDILSAPNMVNREQGRRRILVTCNAEGRDVESVMANVQQRLRDRVSLPAGYHFEYAGEFAAKAEAQRRILWLGALSLLGILLLLYIDLQCLWLSLIVMFSVPLAGVGGVASVLISGGDVSLGSLVGFVTVFGIAVRNGILLISNFERLTSGGGKLSNDLILDGAVERLAPILMTAGTTGLAIVPLIVTGNLPGHEIEHPMAIVIVGGLVSSTILTLLVLPAIYGFRSAQRRSRSTAL